MNHRSRTIHYVILFTTVLIASSVANAHKVSIFVDTDCRVISGEVYFSGGAPGRNLQMSITSPDGEYLGETKTDDQGMFTFNATRDCEHILTVETADGHGAKLIVRPFTMQVDKSGLEKTSIRIRDVVAGLGYILGLTGIACYLQTRRKVAKQPKP